MFLFSKRKLIWTCLIVLACVSTLFGQRTSRRIHQPKEVIDAYRVCERFQTLMAADLNFNRAFDATFTKSAKKRREIAIYEGEFGDVDLANVDDASLVNAFKSRMQIFYLTLPLASPDSEEEAALFFPPEIKAILERKSPSSAQEFRSFALQLNRDVTDLRAHLNQLASRYPRVAERIRKFKSDLSKKATLPDHVVKPLTAYSRGRVLSPNEKYYQIGDYAVIREGTEMRIIGIRFFSRLF